MEFVKPAFIYCGMLVWVESTTNNPAKAVVDCLCEIQTIKSEKKRAEVCDIISRSCFWISFDEIRVKINGHPEIHHLDDSKFWNLIKHPSNHTDM